MVVDSPMAYKLSINFLTYDPLLYCLTIYSTDMLGQFTYILQHTLSTCLPKCSLIPQLPSLLLQILYPFFHGYLQMQILLPLFMRYILQGPRVIVKALVTLLCLTHP